MVERSHERIHHHPECCARSHRDRPVKVESRWDGFVRVSWCVASGHTANNTAGQGAGVARVESACTCLAAPPAGSALGPRDETTLGATSAAPPPPPLLVRTSLDELADSAPRSDRTGGRDGGAAGVLLTAAARDGAGVMATVGREGGGGRTCLRWLVKARGASSRVCHVDRDPHRGLRRPARGTCKGHVSAVCKWACGVWAEEGGRGCVRW